MKEEIFDQQIAESLERLEKLWQRANELPNTSKELRQQISVISSNSEELLLKESLEELSNSIQELQVISEELRQQNDELAASQLEIERERQRYQQLFELAPDAYLVTNPAGVIQEANNAAETLLNVRRDRLIGKPLTVFVPQSNRHEFRSQLNQLQRAQQVRDWELAIQPRNGAWNSPVETDCTVVPVLNLQNQVIGLRWLLRDITERKQAQQVRQQLQMLDAILCASPAQILVCDRQGYFLYASPAAADTFGLAPSDIVGKTGQQLGFLPQTVEIIDAQIQKVLATQTHITDEFSFSVAEKIKYFEYTISHIGGNANNFAAVVITLKDITKPKQAEAEIKKALAQQKELNQLNSRFISIISHGFRNPLNRIFISADLLRNYTDRWTEEQKKQQLYYILSAAKQTKQVLNDMLLVTQAETGKLKFQPGILDLEKFCRQIVEEVQAMGDKGHTIAFSFVGNTSACLDEKLLRPILTDLLSNAVKYSPENSTIKFDLICKGGEAIFQIEDNGIGIPAKDRAQLFSPFYRGSNVGQIDGIGLGLSIVKQCVDLHGGNIALESEVGVGTKITVTLPLPYATLGY